MDFYSNGLSNTDKVMVHEWGHLRWGLFDEYWHKGQDARFSPFYLTDNAELTATKCGKHLEGSYEVSQYFCIQRKLLVI
jgi:hypothetical protein